MKKSLLVTLDFPPQIGGVAKYLKNICANLPTDKIVVLAPKREDSKESDAKRSYKVIRQRFYSRLFWPRWIRLIFLIRKIAKSEGAEILHAGQVLPVGTAIYLLTRVYRRWPYIVYTHGMDVTQPQKYFFKKIWLRVVLKNAFKVVTISQFTRAELLKLGVKPEKIVLIPPGVKVFDVYEDTKALAAQTSQRHDLVGKRVILTVGRLVERKGQDTVIKALPEILIKFPNLIYVIVGPGPFEPNLKELVAKLKLNDHVIFTGEVTDKQKIVWYDLGEIFVMTPRQLANSDVEGFGIVYLEANGLGKPVVASKSGGVADAVSDGINGLLVAPDSPEQTAAAIIKLLSDGNLAKQLGENGRQRAINEFAWPIQAAKLIKILG